MAAPMWHTCHLRCSIFSRTFLLMKHSLTRSYGRGIRRRIVRVLTPEEEQAILQKKFPSDKSKNSSASSSIKMIRDGNDAHAAQMTRRSSLNSKIVKGTSNIDTNHANYGYYGKFKYEKLQEFDKRFGPVINCAKSRKHREKKGEILLEGRRLISDALEAGATAKAIFFSGKDILEDLPLDLITVPLYKVLYKHMKLWSDVVTPAGIMGIFDMPKQGEAIMENSEPVPITLVCDNVRDPGNMGSLIRTAAAIGCKRILATKGCVDIWEPKVLRSGAGCHFRVPIINNLPWHMVSNYLPSSSSVYLADSKCHSSEHMTGNPECLSQLMKDDLESISSQIEDFSESESDDDDNSDTDENQRQVMSSASNREQLEKYAMAPLMCLPYYKPDYSNQDIILVVGGETEGLSLHAKKLAFDNCGEIISIPMAPGVDSLNSTIAGSIILFEMKRQLNNSLQNYRSTDRHEPDEQW